MSSDRPSPTLPRHSRSSPSSSSPIFPRQSRSSPSSSANADINSAAAVTATLPATSSSSSSQGCSMPQSQSSNVLSTVERPSVTDDDSSLLFEDKSLWRSSFAVLYDFYQSGTFCDVEIHVGSRHISCHRLVLACFSQYFRYR